MIGDYMGNRIVIFGASNGAVKVAHTLKNIGIDFDFFIDNDSNKFGKILEGKVIRDPKDLVATSTQYKVIIASMYHSDIENQLLQMGIKKENIVPKEKYILDYIDTNLHEITSQQPIDGTKEKEDNIIIDLGDGMSLGGIEKWGINLSKAICNKNKKVTIITIEEDNEVILDTSINIRRFNLSFDRYIESIKELVDEIMAQLPCTVIINRINQLYMAAHIIKKIYGNDIKIISVIHSDFVRMYEQNELVNNNVDAFLCVSSDILGHFITGYHVDSEKVFFKDSPIYYEEGYLKQYSDTDKPIQIGYGGRLEKAQKRADLLIPLVRRLEESGINYHLNIAGDGSYYNKLDEYIIQNDLEDKVGLYGFIPFDKMNCFWKKCDIFINLSEVEGSCLSMLESMSFGAVPIVTDTSGAKSFVSNNVNGYVANLGDIDTITECIVELSKDKNKLKKFGNASRKLIKSRCNPDEYINYLCDLISK